MDERAEPSDSNEVIAEGSPHDISTAPAAAPSQTDAENDLRAQLSGLNLTPDQTADDIVQQPSRDEDFLREVPPHHNDY